MIIYSCTVGVQRPTPRLGFLAKLPNYQITPHAMTARYGLTFQVPTPINTF